MSTSIAVVAPSHDNASSGKVARRNAVAYHGLRPTLSIASAHTIEAMTPTPEVIQPHARLVWRGRWNPCLYRVGSQVTKPLLIMYTQNQRPQIIRVRFR